MLAMGVIWSFCLVKATFAQEAATPVAPETPTAQAPAPSEPDSSPENSGAPAPKAAVKKRSRQGTREKEAEGTEAPNRFEGDNVIKSQYQRGGQPLEVDPD